MRLRHGVLLVFLAGAMLVAGGAGAASTASSPPVIGVVQAGSTWALRPLDPRTLQPLPGSWSRRVAEDAWPIRSPLGTRVAATSNYRTIFVDSRTGRVVARSRAGVGRGSDFYWFGGEKLGRGGASVLAGWVHIDSFGGTSYQFLDLMGVGDDWADFGPAAVLPNALLLSKDEQFGRVRRMDEGFVGWKPIQASDGVVVVDVLRDRVFLVAADGTIAEVNHVSGTPKLTYHHVDPGESGTVWPGEGLGAAWAGKGKIVLAGRDGLATIDTRTWTRQLISPDRGIPITTPYGIVVWWPDTPGIRVYRPDGTLRFKILEDQVVQDSEENGRPVPGWFPPIALGRYIYLFTNQQRTTVDLATGLVVGPARADARLALPSYVPIP
jgi:hypothetical protein